MAFGVPGPAVHSLIASAPLWIPAALAIFQIDVDWSFTPRAIIYSNQITPIFLAPFAIPETRLIALSRIVQSPILLCLSWGDLGYLWTGWITLALLRCLTGHLLTRSVGWAYPSLFSHWALYESSSGVGPVLAAYLVIIGPSGLLGTSSTIRIYASRRYVPPALSFTMCWLECRPWTYGTALFAVLPIALLLPVFRQRLGLPTPNSMNQVTDQPGPHRYWPSCIAVLLPWLIAYHLISPTRLPLPTSEKPLLGIIMLSFPRPVPTETSVNIINRTIQSYIPYISSAVTLAMFTHAVDHEALRLVQQHNPQVSLHVDLDTHPDDTDGHYLHLAEAFRWMSENSMKHGEWVMLIEDDFPICYGDEGWKVITDVVAKLEASRLMGDIRSGFVGTGGSGIILHRSYLPTLIFLLRSLSVSNTPLHPDVIRRQPDEIIHDCILGRRYSFCERNDRDKKKLLISSRLVLDHIGGMATTTWGKPGNADKWRCGWRHAFHGDEAVEVVVV